MAVVKVKFKIHASYRTPKGDLAIIGPGVEVEVEEDELLKHHPTHYERTEAKLFKKPDTKEKEKK